MSTQSEALLALAIGYIDLDPMKRVTFEGMGWANPIICTPVVHELALASASPEESGALQMMLDNGLLVLADDPAAERARLAGLRPGYQNRAARRAAKRK